jgi:hypothetical protein
MNGYWKTKVSPFGVQFRTVYYGGRKYVTAKHPRGLRMLFVMNANAHLPVHEWVIVYGAWPHSFPPYTH